MHASLRPYRIAALLFVSAAALAAPLPAGAQHDTDDSRVADPEDPAATPLAAPLTEDGDEELIADPLRPAASPATGRTADGDGELVSDPARPTRPAPSAVAPATGRSPSARTGWFTGRYVGQGSVDTRFDNKHEDVCELRNAVELAVRFDPSDRLSTRLEARFTHWATAQRGLADQSYLDDSRATYRAELREAFVRLLLGDVTLTAGQQFLLWGAMDLNSPAQLLHPRDLRYGLAEGTEGLVPILALDARWFLGQRTTLEGVIIPFFEPTQGALVGSDFALGAAGSPLAAWAAVAGVLDRAVAAGYAETLDTAARTLGAPEPSLDHLSVAARLSNSLGGVDLAVGYLWGWDPTPTLAVDPDVATLARAVLRHPDALRTLDPTEVLREPGVLPALARLQDGEPSRWFDASYARRHVAEFDLETYVGALGVRLETVFTPRQTAVMLRQGPGTRASDRELATRRVGAFDAAGGVSWESDDARWVVIVEGFWRHLFGVRDDEQPAFTDVDAYGLTAAVRSKPTDGLELTAGGSWHASALTEYTVVAEARWELAPRVVGFVRVMFFEGPEVAERLTLGGLYDHNDQTTVGLECFF